MPKTLGFTAWKTVLALLFVALASCSQYGEPQPSQPINFPHKIHASDNKIPCMYCHQQADKSAAATVPPVSTCINCHAFVPGRQNPAEVTKVKTAWEQKETVQWNKAHDLPDFVYFPHKFHVRYFANCVEKAADEGQTDLDAACGLNPNQKYEKMTTRPVTEPVSPDNAALHAQYFGCAQCHGPVWEFGVGKRVEPLTMGWCVDCHKNRINKAPAEQQQVLHGRMLDCWTCHK